MRLTSALALLLAASACASAPPPAPPTPAGPTFEQKMSWIFRLEDQRMLSDPAAAAPPPPPVAARGQKPPVVAPPAPPDLLRLLKDDEARIRRRAALAVGRVGLSDGVPPLTGVLADPDPEVRQMAAFALGLIGDAAARPALIGALADPAMLVKGSAAEALGLIGDGSAADAIGRMIAEIVESGALATPPGEEADALRDSPGGAFRLGVYALTRLRAFPQLSAAVLDAQGHPRVRWWPVAYALQRLEDARGRHALAALLQDPHPYTRAFAAKGLGAIRDRGSVPQLLPLIAAQDPGVAVEAVRALGRIGDPSSAAALIKLIESGGTDAILRLEAVAASGGVKGDRVHDMLLDTLGDDSPAVRAAALRALVQFDPDAFVTVLSALDEDPHWSVRAALATVLGTLPVEAALPRLQFMLKDTDERVLPPVLASIATLRPPEAGAILLAHLKRNDPVIRAAAAAGVGEVKPPGGPAALAEAYGFGANDTTYTARAAALSAVTAYGAAEAMPVLTTALADKDWAVRVRAVELIKQFDPGTSAARGIRPATPAVNAASYDVPRVANPPVSIQVFIDTDKGTIQLELAVLDAPLTVENFITLARKGFFNGLTFHRVVPDFVIQGGDPRGDSEGGPGYTIRDELSQRPYLRGTVGMALDWKDTGGSQFFITHAPQPHLDARYTVFARVVAGMEVVDRIQQWDVIRRIRVWDGIGPP